MDNGPKSLRVKKRIGSEGHNPHVAHLDTIQAAVYPLNYKREYCHFMPHKESQRCD